ncbi:MAG: tetratricopeptide repeat protein [Asgard group archaeon]|nr:tetratricopeptide repeat protein [Asgard group archaeon]
MTIRLESQLTDQEASIRTLEDKLLDQGESKELLFTLAEIYYQNKQFTRALNYYLKLLPYDPGNARFWNKVAVIFLRLKKYEEAIDISRIAHRLIDKEINGC